MIPNQTFAAFPEFANSGTKTKPDDAKYAAGFAPADVLPAEWTNYFWAGSTKGITDLNAGVTSLEAEVNNVLSNRGIEPAADNNAQLLAALQSFKAEAILAAHPVGSLYWTSKNENPAVTFGGGTWTQIKDKFILAAGDTYANGATGGAATVTLTTAQMPSHTHDMDHVHILGEGGYVDFETNTATASHNHGLSGDNVKIYMSYEHSTSNIPNNEGIANISYSSYPGQLGGWTVALGSSSNTGVRYLTARGVTDGSSDTTHKHSARLQSAWTHSHPFSQKNFDGAYYKINTGNEGSGNAHNNMPPYATKYCWERTA